MCIRDSDWDIFNNKQDTLTLGNFTTSTGAITITGGTGSIIGSGMTLDIADATTTTKGIASFSDTDFNVAAGAITIDATIARDSELHSAMTMSGTYNYITLSGQDIVRGQVDISDDTNLTAGTLLQFTGGAGSDTLAVKSSTLTSGRLCTYDTTAGLICDTSSSSVGHSAVAINATANGLSVDGSQVLTLGLSSTSTIGALSDTDWDIFNNKQDTLTLGNFTTSTGAITITGGTGSIIGSGMTLDIADATTTTKGIASFSDTDFNVAAGAITIDATIARDSEL